MARGTERFMSGASARRVPAGNAAQRARHQRRPRHHLPVVQRFTPEFTEAARLCRHGPGDRWFADEPYLKVAGRWNYLYRAIDQPGQVIDVLLSARRDLAAARRFFIQALRAGPIPAEVTTDRAPAYPRVLDELIPSALHTVERYANHSIETDHGRLKARLRPTRGLKRHRSVRTLGAGHAFVKTSAAATTNSPLTSPPATGSAQHSTSLRRPSDSRSFSSARSVMRTDRPTQHCCVVPVAGSGVVSFLAPGLAILSMVIATQISANTPAVIGSRASEAAARAGTSLPGAEPSLGWDAWSRRSTSRRCLGMITAAS